MLEECTEDGKCIDQSERSASGGYCRVQGNVPPPWMNCETFAKILTSISNKPDDFRGKEMFQKLSKAIVHVIKREKLKSLIMMNLKKLKVNDS